MANEVTKNPTFATDEEIAQENARRQEAIRQFCKQGAEEIRAAIGCSLDPTLIKALSPPLGEILYVEKGWLVRPEDWAEYVYLQGALFSSMAPPRPPRGGPTISLPSEQATERTDEIQRKLDA